MRQDEQSRCISGVPMTNIDDSRFDNELQQDEPRNEQMLGGKHCVEGSDCDQAFEKLMKWLRVFSAGDQLIEIRGLKAEIKERNWPVTLTGVFDQDHLGELANEALYMSNGC